MNPNSTAPNFDKLPRWVREHIEQLDRRAVIAERALKEYKDTQTESPYFYDEYLCIGDGKPQWYRKYVQTHKISVLHQGVQVDVLLRPDDPSIEISWSNAQNREVPMIPIAYQKIKIVDKQELK